KGNAQQNNIWGYPKDVQGYEFDLGKAKEYFDKAVAEGTPMRRPIEIHVKQPLDQTTQAGQLFQSDLATIGINLKRVNDTFANMTSASAKAETTPQMWIHWISTYYVDPDKGSARCTTAVSTAPGRGHAGTATRRLTIFC